MKTQHAIPASLTAVLVATAPIFAPGVALPAIGAALTTILSIAGMAYIILARIPEGGLYDRPRR